jgi:NAD(P)H-dependent FMN reductase
MQSNGQSIVLNVVTISGSLRKGSFNAALMRALPRLVPKAIDTLVPISGDLEFSQLDRRVDQLHVIRPQASIEAMATMSAAHSGADDACSDDERPHDSVHGISEATIQ